MTTTAFPPGIYRIVVAGSPGVEPDSVDVEDDSTAQHQYLTDGESHVTIHSPNAHPDPKQEWRIEHGKDGNVIIGRPSNKWPSPYLTYEGATKKPEPGDRIKLHVFDFPLNEWRLVHGHGRRYFIHVAGSDLGISIAPPKIYPPFLDLSLDRQLQWVFEFVRHK